MHVAIIGAGAMGTLLGHGFCRGGHDVSVVDLPTRIHGLNTTQELIVRAPDGACSGVRPMLLTTNYSDVESPDVIVLATKSQDLPGIARATAAMAAGQATIVTIQNGIPWWYLDGMTQRFGDARINCLDPDRLLERYIDTRQVVGCVAYPAASLEDDGSVRHVEGIRFPVGELDGTVRTRTEELADLFKSAGFKSRVIADIRSEIWLKAWGALSINPVSALTGATMEDICTHPESRQLIAEMMQEAQTIAEALGARMRHTIEERIEGARAVGPHKTSMLQDVEKGKRLELDGLMLSVLELADITNVPVPAIRHVYACAKTLNERLS